MSDNVVPLRPAQPVGSPRVDPQLEQQNALTASQWFLRPDDHRFITLGELYTHVRRRTDLSWTENVNPQTIEVKNDVGDLNFLRLKLPSGEMVEMTHFAFGEFCKQVGAPASYLRTRPAPIVGAMVQYDLLRYHPLDEVMLFATREGDRNDLRGITSTSYRRVMDLAVVEAAMKISESGWKVPGLMNRKTQEYDPNVRVADKRSTTLYLSDRDVSLFLYQDQFPVEVGKLPDGSPDILFPAFVLRNSETGANPPSFEMLYIRGRCQNRNFWGVEGLRRIRPTSNIKIPDRFAAEVIPALDSFARDAAGPVIAKVAAAKNIIVARSDDERREFLAKGSFPKNAIKAILDSVVETEGHPAMSVWDFTQGITAWARDNPYQDERISWEHRAGLLMERVTA